MGTIALLAWAIALVCVAIGVVVNVALYLKGAFKPGSLYIMRRLEPATLSRETDGAERDFYMSLGATGRPMDAYVRRIIKIFICSILLVSLFVALLIYTAPH
jgi:hypothetical protein